MIWLVACAVEEEPALSVVEDRPWHDYGDDDDADTGETGMPAGVTPDACLSGGGETRDGTLEPSWCARMTPEVDTDVARDTGATIPPPCGFVNMVGAVGLGGDATRPALLYCDSDPGGGVRFARYDAARGTVESDILVPDLCWWDPGAGTLLAREGGYLAMWADYLEDRVIINGVALAEDGAVVALPPAVELPTTAWHPLLVAHDPPLLLVTDSDHAVWAVPVSEDGEAQGAVVATGLNAFSIAAAPTDEGVVVAWCDDAWNLGVSVLDGEGGLVREVGVLGTCGYQAVPTVAVHAGQAAVAWDDGEVGHVALLDGWELQVQGTLPQIGWRGDALWVVDGDGALSRIVDGAVDGAWYLPDVGVVPGQLYGMRVVFAQDTLLVGVIGIDTFTVAGGHVNTYNYVEISATPLP